MWKMKLTQFFIAKVTEIVVKKLDKDKRKFLKILLCILLLGIFIGVVNAVVYNLLFINGQIGVNTN
jgi:uncharacterized membrane protein YvlD (DUF360 family)